LESEKPSNVVLEGSEGEEHNAFLIPFEEKNRFRDLERRKKQGLRKTLYSSANISRLLELSITWRTNFESGEAMTLLSSKFEKGDCSRSGRKRRTWHLKTAISGPKEKKSSSFLVNIRKGEKEEHVLLAD
jgi:hypothetical protein